MTPVLCIHGLWATPATFGRIAPGLAAQGFEVTAPALPFHDRDPALPPAPEVGRLTVEDYVAFLAEAALALPAPPVILGHSMGGMLAQAVAARVPHRALVLLSPAATAQTFVPALATLRTMGGVTGSWGWWHKPTRIAWPAARWGIYNGVPEDIARAEFAGLVWDSGRVIAEMTLPHLSATGATKVDYRRLDKPALVVVGAEDRITVPGIARATARRLAGETDYHELPGVGHWLFWGDTEARLLALIGDWLRRLPA